MLRPIASLFRLVASRFRRTRSSDMDHAVAPSHREASSSGAVHRKVPVQSLAVWMEKTKGEGEDAEPVVEDAGGHDSGVLAVLDGLGGAGGSIYRTEDGESHTSAYFASRIVREVVV